MPARPVLTLAAAMVLNGSLGSLYAFSVFIQPLETHLSAGRGAISAVFAIAAVSFTIAMLATPKLYGRLPAAVLAVAASLLAAAGLGLTAAVPSLIAAWSGYGLLFGFANGVGYSLAVQAVSLSWHRRRGLATGLVVATYAGGAILAAPLFRAGLSRFSVVETLWFTAAAFLIIAAIVAALLAISRVRLPRLESAAGLGAEAGNGGTFWKLWLCLFFGATVGLIVISQAAAIITDYGGSVALAAAGAGLIAAGNMTGRIGAGWSSDHFNLRRIIPAVMVPAALLLLALFFLPSAILSLCTLVMVGFAYGATAGGLPAAVGHYFGAAAVGPVFGKVFTAWGLAGLVMPIVAGYLHDLSGDYGSTLIVAAAAAAITAAAAMTLPDHRN